MPDLIPQPNNGSSPSHRLSSAMSIGGVGHAVDDSIDLREIIAVLRRNKLLVGLITLAVVSIAALLAFSQAPQYRASAVIRLKNERQALTGSLESEALNQAMGKTSDPFLSQLQVLRSRTITGEVVIQTGMRIQPLDENLRLSSFERVEIAENVGDDTASIRFEAETYTLEKDGVKSQAVYGMPVSAAGVSFVIAARPHVDQAQIRILRMGLAIDRVLEKLSTRPLDKTDVVQVDFTHTDPLIAQRVANTAIDVFRTANATESQQQSRRRRLFLEEQLGKTDSVLATAQRELSKFRRREGVFSSREKFAAQQTGLLELDVRREELEADRRVYVSLLQSLANQAGDNRRELRTFVSAPGLAANPVVAQLYTQLLQYQTSKDSVTAGPWGNAAQNPDVQRLNTLIQNTERRLVDAVESHVAAIDARLASLNEMKARNAAQMQGLPDKEAEEMRLMLQVETATKLADQLREEYQKARIAEAIDLGQVEIIDRAGLPVLPIGSGRALKIVLGFILGLMLGSGLAFVREHLNTKVRRRDEIESLLLVPTLAVIPRIAVNGKAELPKLRLALRSSNGDVEPPLEQLVTISEGRSSGAEAYRSLRTNLLFSKAAKELKVVLVTSAMASEGKTTTSANLAVTFAQQGKRVLIVDGDLRKARLHRVFGVTREPGLVDVLAEFATLEESVRPTPVPHLYVLAAGTLPPNPSELLGSPRMREVLDQLRNEYDLLIVDAPPVLVAGDASIISALVDGTVMVVRAGQTERGAALAAVQQLKSVGAHMLGAVLNDPDAKVANYEAHYYYAYQYYGEEQTV